MAQLTISKLNDVSVYRDTSSSLLSSDVMEVSLKIDDTRYVSSKIGLDDLKTFIVGEQVTQNAPHQMFDIFYRSAVDTPFEYQILSGVAVLGSLYSAWPLFIDSSTSNDPSINASAPNWLNKAQNPVSDTSITAQYPEFWTKLIALRDAGKIAYESINVNVPAGIASSLYMTEFNANGYTGRFLIDATNGFVALPILNNSFIRTVASSGYNIGISEVDELKSHTHSIDIFRNQSGGSRGPESVNSFDNTTAHSISATGGLETRPKNVRFCPYMQVSNAYTADSTLDVASSLSGLVYPSIATPTETGTFTSSALNTKVVSPYGLHQGFAITGNQSLSSNGYQKLPGGLIMQWGYISVPPDNDVVATFPIPFVSTVLTAQVTEILNNTGVYNYVRIKQVPSLTSVTIQSANDITQTAYWFVIGY